MPVIEVHLAKGRNATEKRALLAAITSAVHESIGAPLPSIRVWINEVDPAEFMAGGETLAERRTGQPVPVND